MNDQEIYTSLLLAKLASFNADQHNSNYVNDMLSDYYQILQTSSQQPIISQAGILNLFYKLQLRKIPKQQRQYRLSLYKTIDKLKNSLKDYEYALSDSNMSVFVENVNKLISWGFSFTSNFNKEFKNFFELISLESEIRSPDIDDEKDTTQLPKNTKEKSQKNKEEKQEKEKQEKEKQEKEKQEKEKQEKEKLPNVNKELIAQLKTDLLYLSTILEYTFSNYKIQEKNKHNILNNYKQLQHSMNTFLITYDTSEAEQVQNLTELYNSIRDSYDKLLSLFIEFYKKNANIEAASFQDLHGQLSLTLHADTLIFDNQLMKISHNFITRWIRRKLLNQKKNAFDHERYNLVIAINNVYNKLLTVKNKLVDKNTTNELLVSIINDFNKDLIQMYSILINTINVFFYNQSTSNKKNILITDIKKKKIINDINTIIGNIYVF